MDSLTDSYWKDRDLRIGEGDFTIEASQTTVDLLKSRGLLDDGLPHLLNGLADLLLNYEELSELEYYSFEKCFSEFRDGPFKLYAHVLDQAGPEGIGKNLWLLFALMERPHWPFRTEVFKDMPTGVLEEIAQDVWDAYRDVLDLYGADYFRTSKPELIESIKKALRSRSDIYGDEKLSSELAFGILIEEKR